MSSPQAAEQRAARLEADRRQLPRRPGELRSQTRRDQSVLRWLARHGPEVLAAATAVLRDRALLPTFGPAADWVEGIEEILVGYTGSMSEQASLLAHFRLLAAECGFGGDMAHTPAGLREGLRLAAGFAEAEGAAPALPENVSILAILVASVVFLFVSMLVTLLVPPP